MSERSDKQPSRVYRDPANGRLLGVCAGLADYFGFDLLATRVLTIVAQFLFPPTFLIYLGLAFLLPRKPQGLYRDESEEEFWRGVRKSPQATFSSVRHKFREMDLRLQRLERYVTSPRFDLDREFENLKRK